MGNNVTKRQEKRQHSTKNLFFKKDINMNEELDYTSAQEQAQPLETTEEVLNEICETCGKWTTNNDDHCYGCKRPVKNCCC